MSTDNHGASSAPSTVGVTITGSNDGPTVAVNDITTADDHSAVKGSAVGHDVDVGDTVSYSLLDSHGNHVTSLDTAHGHVEINAATGEYTFTPVGDSALGVGAKQNDSFQVVSTDNHGASSAPSTVGVTITGSNDGPVASDVTISTSHDHSISGHGDATDVDVGDQLTYAIYSPTHSLTVDLGGEAYQGNPHYQILVDGKVVGEGDVTWARDTQTLDGSGQKEGIYHSDAAINYHPVTIEGVQFTGNGPHNVQVAFTNDAWGGGEDDRNLIVGDIKIDSQVVKSGATHMWSQGSTSFDVSTALTSSGDGHPAHGAVTLSSDGSYIYTPNEGFVGADKFVVAVSDGHGGTTTETIAVNVTNANPIIDAVTGSGTGHVAVTGQILAHDTDDTHLSYSVGVTHDLNVQIGGEAYQGNPHYQILVDGKVVGEGDVTWARDTQALDGSGQKEGIFHADGDVQFQTVHIPNVPFSADGGHNVQVVFTNDAWGGGENDRNLIVGTISVGDHVIKSDVTHMWSQGTLTTDASSALETMGGLPQHGHVAIDSSGNYTYVPADGYTGADSFQVVVADGHGGTATQTVDVHTTNAAPLAPSVETLATDNKHVATGSVGATDADGDTLSYTVGASHSLTVNLGGEAYQGNPHYQILVDGKVVGEGDVTWARDTQTIDGSGQKEGIYHSDAAINYHPVTIDGVQFTGNGPHNVQVAFTNDAWGGGEDDRNLIVGDIKIDSQVVKSGATHMWSQGSTSFDATAAVQAVGTGQPQNGSVTIDSQGNFSYTPNTGFVGNDSFVVQVADGHGGTTTQVVNVGVADGNHAPTVTVAPLTTLDDHSAIKATVAGHDVDVGDTVSYSLVDSHGNHVTSLDTTHGHVSINSATGEYSFTPTNDSSLGVGAKVSDSFQVVATDNHGASSAPATVGVTITGSNDGPTVSVSDVTTADDHSAIKATAVGHDVDVGDTVSYSLVDSSGNHVTSLDTAHGHVSINSTTGEYTFTPTNDSSLGVGAKVSDSFQVVATDNHGASSAPSTVGVTITGSNDAPVVDLVTGGKGNESTVITGQVSGHDPDAGDAISFHVSGGASDGHGHELLSTAHGLVNLNTTDGTYTFTPTGHFAGSDAFQVVTTDNHGASSAATTVNVTVNGVADAATVGVSIGAGTVTPNGSFTVQNLDGDAGYSNSYGYYVTDANGNPTSGQILFANHHGEVNQSMTVTGVDPDHVGFFIIPNGHTDNASLTDHTNISFSKDSAGHWQAVDSSGHILTGTGANVLFDKGSLNTDGITHVRDASGDGGNQNWEDLNGGGDRDFNDTNVQVTWNTAAPTSIHALTLTASFPDMTGNETHSVKLSNLPAGSTLYQDGVALTAVNGAYTIDPAHLTGLSVKTAAGFSGDINVTVTAVSSESGTVATATASAATVHDDLSNHAPVADASHTYSDTTNTVLSGAIAATDADGNHLSYALATGTDGAQHGSVILGTDGSFTYTPTANWNGSDHFNVLISDGHGGTTTETIAVNVAAPNHAPVIDASHTTATLNLTDAHSANMGQVTATDADNDSLTYSVLSDTSTHHGNLVVDSTSGSYFYDSTDTSWKGGKDTFTVQVDDHHGGLASQTVTVNVSGTGNADGVTTGHSGGGKPVGWGDGGGRTDNWGDHGAWGTNGAWEVGGSGGNAGHVVTTSTDSHWGSGWYAWDSGNPGHAGTGDTFSIAGYNQHNHVISGDNNATLLGAAGNDYISLDDGSGNKMMSGISHVQLGDGNAVLDMTTPRMDYLDNNGKPIDMTVAGGSGHDVIWTASGNDLITTGVGNNTVHAGAGDDTIVAGTGDNVLMGQEGNDTFLFDFGHGHNTVDGGAGTTWTDTVDLSTNMHAGATMTITTADNHSWTVVSDGDHQAHGTINLGQDKGGDITVHSTQGDETIHFTNIENIKY